MGVGSHICQCNSHPRQADSIKVIVLCANGKYVLTLIFFPLIVFSSSFEHNVSLLSLNAW